MRFGTSLFACFRLRFPLLLLAVVVLASGSLAFAGTIHGTVTNMTSNKASSGDTVTLLSLTSALDEVGHAKTDGQGHFTLTTPTDSTPFLIRVEHDKSNYFKNVPPGTTTVEITVYDAAAKVNGVSTEADVMRIESEQGQLKVTENYFVKNVSAPPKTMANERTYEVVLPADAVLDGAATVGPNGMPVAATPDPVDPKGHYAFSFPIRPNEGESGTRFQLTYHIPYTGNYTFKPKVLQGTDNLAIMLPKSMIFQQGTGANYQTVPDQMNAQTYLMRGVKNGEPASFTVSGQGAIPRDAEPGESGGAAAGAAAGAQSGQDASAPGGAATAGGTTVNGPNGTPGGGLGNPIDTPDPLSKYKYWILGGLVLLMAVGAAFLLRKPAVPVVAAVPSQPVPTASVAPVTMPATSFAPLTGAAKSHLLLEALKEELFAIESERIAGTLSVEEYAEVKASLETVLRRALNRNQGPGTRDQGTGI